MELELNFSFLSLQVPAVIELYKFCILFSIETGLFNDSLNWSGEVWRGEDSILV